MTERVLSTKKNGMAVLLLSILLYAAAIVGVIFTAMAAPYHTIFYAPMVLCIVYLCVGWLFWPGRAVLRLIDALGPILFGQHM